MSDCVLEINGVTKRFGRNIVLDNLDLSVPQGQTFAFLGRNGAGKTTTIQMLLGLLKCDAGQMRVLGLDPKRDATAIRRRVGYMAEDQRMFGWMRVDELLRFISAFYPTWDGDLANEYVRKFELSKKAKVKHLSKGQNCRLALLLALVHRPELVILDDPTLGLDPIMRKEFLRDVVEYLQGEGVTVFFSSHLLYEIEPVADQVAILDGGRIVCQDKTEQLRERVKQLIIPTDQLTTLPGTLDVKPNGRHTAVVVEDVSKAQQKLGDVKHEVVDLNLDEIFEAYVIGRNNDGANHENAAVERVA